MNLDLDLIQFMVNIFDQVINHFVSLIPLICFIRTIQFYLLVYSGETKLHPGVQHALGSEW